MVLLFNLNIMDTISYKKNKQVSKFIFTADVNLGNMVLPILTKDEVSVIAPLPVEGVYRSDVASLEKQPSLMNRIQRLPARYAPRGMEDEELFTYSPMRSLHDMADIDNVSKLLLSETSKSEQMDSFEPSSSTEEATSSVISDTTSQDSTNSD